IWRQPVCVAQKPHRKTRQPRWRQRYLIGRRYEVDVIKSIRVAVSDVASRRRRIRQPVASIVHKVGSSIRGTRIFEAQSLSESRRRALADTGRFASADDINRPVLIYRQARVPGEVDLHVELQS